MVSSGTPTSSAARRRFSASCGRLASSATCACSSSASAVTRRSSIPTVPAITASSVISSNRFPEGVRKSSGLFSDSGYSGTGRSFFGGGEVNLDVLRRSAGDHLRGLSQVEDGGLHDVLEARHVVDLQR